MVYTPVMAPACLAKSRLTIPAAIRRLMPMLAPAIQLPANKPTSPNELRRVMPAASVSSSPDHPLAPKRRAGSAPTVQTTQAQHRQRGSNPALAADKPRLADTSLSNGDRLDNADAGSSPPGSSP